MRDAIKRAIKMFIPTAAWKAFSEAWFWTRKRIIEGRVNTFGGYEYLYRTTLGIDADRYGVKWLDVGCGPASPLSWCCRAEVIGCDPLAWWYRIISDQSAMPIVNGKAEDLPFDDGMFDVVTMVNCLDHVDDPAKAVRESMRVLKIGGLLVVLVDSGQCPTDCEPHTITREWFNQFGEWEISEYQRVVASGTMSAMIGEPFTSGLGVIIAKARGEA